MTGFASALYAGTVVHHRLKPVAHKLRYRVAYLLLDLDEMPLLARHLKWLGINRRSLFAHHDADHGSGTGTSLRPWVEAAMRQAGIEPDGGPIRLLAIPRIFGYAFNPLAVYFCYGREGRLNAILYQVSNTFGERHSYLLPVEQEGRIIRQQTDKNFYVSPFIEMATRYHFRIRPPDSHVSLAIRQTDAEGALLQATFTGQRLELSDRGIARALLRWPFMTRKVTLGIHWEALLLWLKGMRLIHRPPPPVNPVSVP